MSSGPRTPEDLPSLAQVTIREDSTESYYSSGHSSHSSSTLPLMSVSSVPHLDIDSIKKKRKGSTGKGLCRGCGDQIVGKSVSSKDGSLSGKWHKTCFCCAECGTRNFQQGLTTVAAAASTNTAEFYILKDRPLCHGCYHRENNSVCEACQGGIEGACLDLDAGPNSTDKLRYHVACVKCADCSVVLDPQIGYVSVLDGVFFCPNHAESRLLQSPTLAQHQQHQQPPGLAQGGTKTSVVEKRRTRMLMM